MKNLKYKEIILKIDDFNEFIFMKLCFDLTNDC